MKAVVRGPAGKPWKVPIAPINVLHTSNQNQPGIGAGRRPPLTTMMQPTPPVFNSEPFSRFIPRFDGSYKKRLMPVVLQCV